MKFDGIKCFQAAEKVKNSAKEPKGSLTEKSFNIQ